jgi:hypothetical protein
MFYRRLKPHKERSWKERLSKNLELVAKSLIMVILPFAVAIVFGLIWYYALYIPGIHFSAALENIAVGAWIPMFGIIYGLLATIVLASVWEEYKKLRSAVKRGDIETFIELRDESVSPLVHTLMSVLSLSVLAGFMGLDYPSATSGLVVITSTAYLLALIFFVVEEIDDPCDGLWFIKDIPEPWLNINVDEYRLKYFPKI